MLCLFHSASNAMKKIRRGARRERGTKETRQWMGGGFFVKKTGYCLTPPLPDHPASKRSLTHEQILGRPYRSAKRLCRALPDPRGRGAWSMQPYTIKAPEPFSGRSSRLPAWLLPASQKASTVKGQMYGSAARDGGAAFFAFRVGILCPEGGRDGR